MAGKAFIRKKVDNSLENLSLNGGTITLNGGKRIGLEALKTWPAYQLAAENIFAIDDPTPPGGQYLVSVDYQLVGGVVTAVPAFAPVPLSVIPMADFLGRLTDTEYSDLYKARAQGVQTNQMTLVRQLDQFTVIGKLDLNLSSAATFKAALVTANILTQPRADAIFV